MKRYKKLLTAVWVIGIILVVFAIVLVLFGLIPSKDIEIATYYILVADYSLPFILLALPLAIGFDIIAWTIGVIIWLFGYGSWPGKALEIVLSAHPVINHVFYVVFLLLGLFVMVVLPYWIFSAVRKAMNTQKHLDWGSSIVGTITLVMGMHILAHFLSPRGIAIPIIDYVVEIPALATGILLPLKYKRIDYNFLAGLFGIVFSILLFATRFYRPSFSIYSIWFIIYAARGILQVRTYRTVAPSQYSVLMVLNLLLLVLGLLGVALPFFALGSLPLVVAIALIIESLITWLE